MKRWWYTESEWSKQIGWGQLPKEYTKHTHIKDKDVFDYQDEDHPYESWDQFLVRRKSSDLLNWYSRLLTWEMPTIKFLKREEKK